MHTVSAAFAAVASSCGQPGSPFVVSPGSTQQGGSSINDLGEVVWSQYDPATGHYQIYSSTRGQLTTDVNDHYYPSINKFGDVVWQQYDAQHTTSIFGLISGRVIQVTYGSGDSHPSINDSGEIVYNAQGQIYSTIRGQLTNDIYPLRSSSPSINNKGDVVWSQMDDSLLVSRIFKLASGATAPVAVTDGTTTPDSPSINDSGEIVWVDVVSGQQRLVSSTRGQLTSVCPVADGHLDPHLNDCGDIVFTASTIMNDSFVMYRLGSSSPCVVPPPPGGFCAQPGSPVPVSPSAPQLYESSMNDLGEVVWSQYEQGTGHTQIFSNIRGKLTSDMSEHRNPSINNLGTVVWGQDDNDSSTIRGLVSGMNVQITSGGSERHPSINDGGEVVYESLGQIYSTTRGRLTTADYILATSPEINNKGQVVWEQFDDQFNRQIYTLPSGTGAVPVAVTSGPISHLMPSINDSGEIVWVEDQAVTPIPS
jgi:hypothetical protein